MSPAWLLLLLLCRNVMGMMNNCCYRVKVHPRQTDGETAWQHLAGPSGRWPQTTSWLGRLGTHKQASTSVLHSCLPAGSCI